MEIFELPETIQFTNSKEVLSLKNVSGQRAAYKVKTTHPAVFLVRPTCGIVAAEDTCDVDILRSSAPCGNINNVKFLIQSVIVQSADYNEGAMSPEELKDVAAEEFQKAKKEDIVQKKIEIHRDSTDVGPDVGSTNPSSSATMVQNPSNDYNDLKKKYDELVTYTVTLTNQRDKCENEVKNLRKKIRELENGKSTTDDPVVSKACTVM